MAEKSVGTDPSAPPGISEGATPGKERSDLHKDKTVPGNSEGERGNGLGNKLNIRNN